MPEKELLSSQEFAEQAGVTSSTVSKWLRSGKIKGSKQGGKWMISADQLPHAPASGTEEKPSPSINAKSEKQPVSTGAKPSNTQSYTIEEFSALTYLTPFGVIRFLKEGRLSGSKSDAGRWRIDGSNLEKAAIQKLIRK